MSATRSRDQQRDANDRAAARAEFESIKADASRTAALTLRVLRPLERDEPIYADDMLVLANAYRALAERLAKLPKPKPALKVVR